MGAVLSTIILLVTSLGLGVSSAMTATAIHRGDWSRVKLMSSITGGVSILIILFVLYILLAHGSVTEEFLIGAKVSLILMLLATMGVAALQFIILHESMQKNPKAYWTGVGSATLAFGVFLLSLIVTVFFA